MSSSTEETVRAYIAAAQEPDAGRRAALLEACFAEDGRLVSLSREVCGRAAVAAELDAFFADPRGLTARLASAIDVGVRSFRFRSVVELRDGSPALEFHDAGEVDGDGRIALVLSFPGPLRDAAR